MAIRVIFSAICCIMTVVASSHALAQEISNIEQPHGDVVALAERAEPPRWDASVEAVWLPASSIHGTGGNLTMEEVRVGFGRRFMITPRLGLSTGLRYSLQNIDAPDSALLPGSL